MTAPKARYCQRCGKPVPHGEHRREVKVQAGVLATDIVVLKICNDCIESLKGATQ